MPGLRKDHWCLDEPGDRNRLLAAGREIGGTHFVSVDADEAFTSNCACDDYLRGLILGLLPGDQIAGNWLQLWRSDAQFRFDDSVWTWNYKGVIFCDDGRCDHSSAFVHTPRVPGNLSGRVHRLPGCNHGLMHFQFVNWRNLLVKQAWYRCLEHVCDPEKPEAAINRRYAATKDESRLGLREAPASWLSGYTFYDPVPFNEPEWWREKQVRAWFKEKGLEYFKGLDIWDIDWSGETARIRDDRPVPAPSQADLSERAVPFIDLAEKCQAEGDLNGARAALVNALNWAPEVVDLVLAAGDMHRRAGDVLAARWEALRVTRLQPKYPLGHFRLAEAALALDRAEEFEAAIRRVFELPPGDTEALRLLGDFQLQHEQYAAAAEAFSKVLERVTEDMSALLRLGLCRYKEGRLADALAAYRRVLSQDAENAVARENVEFLEAELAVASNKPAGSAAPVPQISAAASS